MTFLDLLMWVGIGLGLLLLPRLGTVLGAILPVLQTPVSAARTSLALLARTAWRQARDLLLVTEVGELKPAAAISQVVGAIVLTAAGLIFAACDLHLTWATLGPLFGMPPPSQGTLWASWDWMLAVSLVMLSVVYGCILSDLLGWTMFSRFAVARHGRVAAFCVSFVGFVASLGVAVALAAYRLPALLGGDGSADGSPELLAWLQSLPGPILLTLAAVLFLGTALAVPSVETFFTAVVALVVSLSGGLFGLGSLLLRVGEVAIEAVRAAVTALAAEPMTQAVAERMQRVGQGVASRGRAFGAWLHNLVHRGAPVAAKPLENAPVPTP
jgi:hypothetical protein